MLPLNTGALFVVGPCSLPRYLKTKRTVSSPYSVHKNAKTQATAFQGGRRSSKSLKQTIQLALGVMPVQVRWGTIGAVSLGVMGGVVGLVVGLLANAGTAWFAILELGIPSAISGIVRSRTSGFTTIVTVDGCHRVVFLTGEWDIAAAEAAYLACVVGVDRDVVVDLGSVTFMDSCGYRALSAARDELQQLGMTMMFRSLGGQPARLVGLLAAIESRAGVATSPSTTYGVGLEQSFGSAGTAGTTITANPSPAAAGTAGRHRFSEEL